MKRWLLGFFATVAVVYVALCLLVWLLQDRLLFFRGAPPRSTPADVGLEYREVELVAVDGVRLHGWWIPHPDATRAVLVAHGNAGSIEYRLPLAEAFHAMGFGVLLFDYRGYGKSEGRPTEAGLYRDGEAAYAFLADELGLAPEAIVLFGESLGGGVVTELALRRPCGALVLESAFTSVPDVAAEVYPFLPVRLLSRFAFANVAKLGRVAAPVLVIHSPADEIVPFAHAERLLAAAREPKQLLRTAGGHNDGGFRLSRAWREEVQAFLAR